MITLKKRSGESSKRALAYNLKLDGDYMGLIGSILSIVFNVVSNDVEHKADDFYSGYDRGSSRASHMSDGAGGGGEVGQHYFC